MNMLQCAALLTLLALTSGCGESAEAIHNAADAATGNQAVRESLEMRDQIQDIRANQREQMESVLGPGH